MNEKEELVVKGLCEDGRIEKNWTINILKGIYVKYELVKENSKILE